MLCARVCSFRQERRGSTTAGILIVIFALARSISRPRERVCVCVCVCVWRERVVARRLACHFREGIAERGERMKVNLAFD